MKRTYTLDRMVCGTVSVGNYVDTNLLTMWGSLQAYKFSFYTRGQSTLPLCVVCVRTVPTMYVSGQCLQCMCQDSAYNVCVRTVPTMYVSGQYLQCMCQDSAYSVCVRTVPTVYVSGQCLQCMCQDSAYNVCVRTVPTMYVSGQYLQCMCQDSAYNVCVRTVPTMYVSPVLTGIDIMDFWQVL
jgi:hypothetical protein